MHAQQIKQREIVQQFVNSFLKQFPDFDRRTGIVIYSQTEKSQIQNKEKAFQILRARLYDLECQKAHDAEADLRRSQIGTGDRSEKIRTYNFPQGRVTDHRIGLTLYRLEKVMNGDIQEIIDACIAADQAAKLLKVNQGEA